MMTCLACGGERTNDGPCPGCGASVERMDGFPAFAPEIARGGDGYDASRFAFLSGVQDANFWFRARHELVAWAVNRCFPRARALLDVGCGTGTVLAHLGRVCPQLERLAGSDVHVEALRLAADRLGGRARLFQMDARRVPFREEFDLVCCLDVIEHIQEDAVALAALHAALRRGGGLVVTVPQHGCLWSRHDEIARHVRRYAARDLAERVRRAGFAIELETSFVTLLLPVMFISRLLERVRAPRETEGLEVSGRANEALYSVMRVERALIARGARFPVGGSRLLVARRE